MISEQYSKRYCCEDISLVENFDKAIADVNNIWDLHHRAEIQSDRCYSIKELKERGLYWHRPASELIFMTHSEHAILHNKFKSPRKLSMESRVKIRINRLGKHWYNDGVRNIFAHKCPDGYVKGRLKRTT